MKKNNLIILLLFVILISLPSWRGKTPEVFVIGDSISMQYGPYLAQYLEGFYDYSRKESFEKGEVDLDIPTGANGGDSRMVLEFLKIKLNEKGFRPDVLLLNCGLHDIKRNPKTKKIQVEPKQYKKNLEEIHQIVTEKGIQLAWIKTTPVEDERHNSRQKSFFRYSADLAQYNQIADDVFQSRKVPIIDLFGFTRNLGEDTFVDHVHYNEKTRALQAAFISGFLLNIKDE